MSTPLRYCELATHPVSTGDCWYADWRHAPGEPCPYWDNCDGKHIIVVFPDRYAFDICTRASNCTMPEDRLHRCWVIEGELPNITASKNGRTCAAGAGSFLLNSRPGGWHGFIRGGEITE